MQGANDPANPLTTSQEIRSIKEDVRELERKFESLSTVSVKIQTNQEHAEKDAKKTTEAVEKLGDKLDDLSHKNSRQNGAIIAVNFLVGVGIALLAIFYK